MKTLKLALTLLSIGGLACAETPVDAATPSPARASAATIVSSQAVEGGIAVTRESATQGSSTTVLPAPTNLALLGIPDPERSLQVGLATRTYIPYVGRAAKGGAPAPLVFVHHGFTMSAQVMADLTTWKNIADREGLIIAFANGNTDLGGLSAPWNVGFPVCGVGTLVSNPGQDDLGFVDAMIADVKTLHPVDDERIYTNGFSMGGYFTNQIGCQRSKLLRGIAPHSGGASLDLCPAYEPLPVLVLHGDADPLIDYNCGVDAKELWRQRNGCSDTIERTETVLGGKCEYYAGCKAAVGMCTFSGMGHGWAGAVGLGLPFDYAGGIQYANAAELIWKFWQDNP